MFTARHWYYENPICERCLRRLPLAWFRKSSRYILGLCIDCQVRPTQGIVKHTKSHPCRVCGGYPDLPRGQSIRCVGFRLGDIYAFCTREEHAGRLTLDESTQPPAYRHYFGPGTCKCGVNHTGREAKSAPQASSNTES